MSQVVFDCPRCDSNRMTFDVKGCVSLGIKDGWQECYEVLGKCNCCHRGIILFLEKGSAVSQISVPEDYLMSYRGVLNDLFIVVGHLTAKDFDFLPPPDDLPENIESAFIEGSKCMSIDCYNAAGTMFRLCLDFATKKLLPEEDISGLNNKIRRSLGLRMQWLFDQKYLSGDLSDLADCVKNDGNDGAHEGNLDKASAEDLQDFTEMLLERLYSEPARLEEAKQRRLQRRSQ
ncbi:DUF4145 domain-containing protein [Serratia quinivorans]|uniref:DUF4145 domain-containing protein n=1 Tax=Serratia quinivorans TaxID=137545 RepID=UPI002179889D|nr:DUF4145 domain-containing protein [Serratia quinivorans]CAI1026615.1 Uncharacterised protein [Serratia quinivorans]CAI1786140.1 Uncharacterised protein [Serratia quinivorans]